MILVELGKFAENIASLLSTDRSSPILLLSRSGEAVPVPLTPLKIELLLPNLDLTPVANGT